MDISLEHDNFDSVELDATTNLKHSGSSKEFFRKSESTGSIRFASSESLYEQNENSKIDGLHLTEHKDGFFLNRRKIQKIEYIKYLIKTKIFSI